MAPPFGCQRLHIGRLVGSATDWLAGVEDALIYFALFTIGLLLGLAAATEVASYGEQPRVANAYWRGWLDGRQAYAVPTRPISEATRRECAALERMVGL